MTGRERVAFAAIVAVYLLLSLLVFDQIEEDAFIDFRVAGNLVDGYGFVFNQGGPPIEVASSLLWELLLVLLWKAPLNIVIAAKLLGIAAGCGCLWFVFRIARRQIAEPLLRLGPPLLTVASIPFLMWSQRGLETPLFGLLVLGLVVCCTDARWVRWWPAVAVLLLLTRPEAPLFLLALIPAVGFDTDRWRAVAPGILVVAAALAALLVARFFYFHDFVPAPFYVKLQTTSGVGLAQIRKYIVHNHVLLVAIPLFLVGWRRSFWTRERLVLGALVVTTAVWCGLANDYMPHVRHLVAAIPLLYVLIFAAADGLPAGFRRSRVVLSAYIAAAFILTLFLSRSTGEFTSTRENAMSRYVRAFVAEPAEFLAATAAKIRTPASVTSLDLALQRYGTIGSTYQSLVGELLWRNYAEDAVVVYDQMGQTPFYAGAAMHFVDSLGLTDRTVGRFYFERWRTGSPILALYDRIASRAAQLVFGEIRGEITANEVLDYLFGRNPDVILINTTVVDVDPAGIPAALSRDQRLTRDYELRYRVAGFVMLYERRDAPRRRSLAVPFGLGVVPVK